MNLSEKVTTGLGVAAVASLFYQGALFIKETKALPGRMAVNHTEVALALTKIDRTNGNVEDIMTRMKIRPRRKSDTELQLEQVVTQAVSHHIIDDTQSTDDTEGR